MNEDISIKIVANGFIITVFKGRGNIPEQYVATNAKHLSTQLEQIGERLEGERKGG